MDLFRVVKTSSDKYIPIARIPVVRTAAYTGYHSEWGWIAKARWKPGRYRITRLKRERIEAQTLEEAMLAVNGLREQFCSDEKGNNLTK